ncbi:MAG: DUF4405 domain-containing protein, partial [Anaerolineae bacterium]|nr:DUF4405 domain-containing protein [Anaerolineae bacterium]
MKRTIRLSRQTRANWLIDAVVFVGGLLAALSGIYFLYLPSGGYRGGRNPAYGLQILFERHTWSDLHLVTGLVMVAAVAVHLAIHWRWVKMMARRVVSALVAGPVSMSRAARLNLVLDAVVALAFVICAVSGIALLLLPGGRAAVGPGLLSSRVAWDLVHTWSGVALIAAAAVHFAIHWRWVKNVTV